jgi:hypothetical protein
VVEIYHQSLNEIPSRKRFKPTAETAVGTDSREQSMHEGRQGHLSLESKRSKNSLLLKFLMSGGL